MTNNTRYTQAQQSEQPATVLDSIQPTQAEPLVNPFSLAKSAAQEAVSNDAAKYYYGNQLVESTGHAGNRAGQLVQTGVQQLVRFGKFATIHAIADTYKVIRFTGLQVEAKVKVLTWNKGDEVVVPYQKVQGLYSQVKGWLDQAAQMPLPGQDAQPVRLDQSELNEVQNAVINSEYEQYEYVEPISSPTESTTSMNMNPMGFDWSEYGKAIDATTPVVQEQPEQVDPTIDTPAIEDITAGIRELQLLDMATAAQLKKEPWASLAKSYGIDGYQQMKMADKKDALSQAINSQYNLTF